MEEAEILCDTVGWLKSGNFICIGNPEKLKLQYSAGYRFHIKFDDTIIKPNLEIINSIESTLNEISMLVDGVNNYINYINNNPQIEPYIKALIEVVKIIREKTNGIVLNQIGQDLSFELIIYVNKLRQKELFSYILNLKNINQHISEASISLQSLESILTSFK